MPCSIPPPILKYQHFASNGPYAPRACKPKSIATYYKTALQILHTSQNLLLGMLPSCQLAEQRLGLSKEICGRMMAGYAHAHIKGDTGCGWLELESGHLSCKLSLERESKTLRASTCFQAPSPQRGSSEVSMGCSCRNFYAGVWTCSAGPIQCMLWVDHGSSAWTPW